jgi:hypothetical protein
LLYHNDVIAEPSFDLGEPWAACCARLKSEGNLFELGIQATLGFPTQCAACVEGHGVLAMARHHYTGSSRQLTLSRFVLRICAGNFVKLDTFVQLGQRFFFLGVLFALPKWSELALLQLRDEK